MKLNKRTFTFIRDLGVTEESFRLEKVQDTIFVDRIHVSQPLLSFDQMQSFTDLLYLRF